MKIFYVCYENLGIEGAAATHVREVAENLQAFGNKVHIFTPKFQRFRFPVRVDVTYIPLLPIGKFKELGYYIFLWFVLVYFWKKKGVDLIYVREMGLNFVPYLFSKILRKKIFVEINGLVTEELKLTGTSLWKIKLIRIMRRMNLTLSDKIIVVTPGLKDRLNEEYGLRNGKLNIVQNGANPYIFVPMDKLKARRLLGLSENEYYLCYVGNFYPHHGLEHTLVIFKQLLKFQPNTTLLLIGDGYEKRRIKYLSVSLGIERRVLFFANKIQTDLPRYIGASDACLLLFHGNHRKIPGLSLKIFEYMSCSRPVITAKGEETGSFIQQLNSGIVVDPTNPNKAAAYIATLLTDEILKERLGAFGRSAILNNYTWRHTAERILKIYYED